MQEKNITLTAEQASEMEKCANSFDYFCDHYARIRTAKGIVSLQLFDFQRRYAKALQEKQYLVTTKFRQGGFTTTTAIFCLWKLLFSSNQNILWNVRTDWEARGPNDIVQVALKYLPDWMIGGIDRLNDHEIRLGNGNTFLFYRYQSGCGRYVSLLVVDEAAYIDERSWSVTLPCLGDSGSAIVLSTAKVLQEGEKNWFVEICQAAIAGKNKFQYFQVNWQEHPDYNNTTWMNKVKANLGDIGWRVEIAGEFVVRTKAEIEDCFDERRKEW
jgi:hypothetical protein